MEYIKHKNKIIIYDKTQFNLNHIFECGQIFSYKKCSDKHYIVYSADKVAELIDYDSYIEIKSDTVEYFEIFFDLKKDYNLIKTQLSVYECMQKPIQFGNGIRLLKQDILETIISFAISANNNISRIQKTVFAIRQSLGEKINDYYAFPTIQKLKTVDEAYFKSVGAGYRSSQLVVLINQLANIDLNETKKYDFLKLKNWLLSLSGVGEKVANCILLFGYAKYNVFPVDTWIEKVYCDFFEENHNRLIIMKNLLDIFGDLSGYAQQYLFFYKRTNKLLI